MGFFACRGFSLVEIMLSLGIISVLLAGAVPAYTAQIEKRRLVSAAESIYEYLQLARSHAVKTSSDTYVDFEIDGGDNWTVSLSRESGCDPEDEPADSNPCYIVVDDGDSIIDDSDYVQHQLQSADFNGVNITNVTFGSDEAKFRYIRGTAKAGSVKLESDNGYRLKVISSMLGRIRICSPSGDYHVGGYPHSNCSW